ncbi:MAG: NADH-quinone oxidoreductase subunit NuoE [Pseudomonadota bacterium]
MSESKLHLLTDHSREEIDQWLSRYPEDRKQSAVLAALRIVQHQNEGHVTVELMDAIAEYLDMEPISVYEVASFYSMIETKPCGRHHVSVCNNIACMLVGGEEILEHCEQKLGIKAGESTPDGRILLKKEEECLAACGGGPMMQVDHVYYENLTPEKVDEILDKLD